MQNPQLNRALASWPDWGPLVTRRPQLIGTLGAGLTNQSYILQADNRRLVLRLDRADASSLGVDRAQEQRIWQAVAESGIAPEIVHADSQSGLLIYSYIDGRPWTPADFADSTQRARLHGLIQRYQAIALDLPPRNYIDYLNYYWQQLAERGLDTPELRAQWAAYLPQLRALQNSDWQPVLAHHDLIPDNIIDTGDRLYIVDWEYAALGHPDLDWACVIGECDSAIGQAMDWINRLWWLLLEASTVSNSGKQKSQRQ